MGLDNKDFFPGLLSSGQRADLIVPEQIIAQNAKEQANVSALRNKLQQISQSYFDQITRAADVGDATEVISTRARTLRYGRYHLGKGFQKVGLDVPDGLNVEDEKNLYIVKWSDSLGWKGMFSEDPEVNLTSTVAFRKSWDPTKYVESYSLEVTEPAHPDLQSARVDLILNNDQVVSQSISWETSQWRYILDDVLSRRLEGESYRPSSHSRGTPLGRFLQDLALFSNHGPRYVSLGKGRILTTFTGIPEIKIEGTSEYVKGNFHRKFVYNPSSESFRNVEETGESNKLYWMHSESDRTNLTTIDVLNFVRGGLLLIPTAAPEENIEELQKVYSK